MFRAYGSVGRDGPCLEEAGVGSWAAASSYSGPACRSQWKECAPRHEGHTEPTLDHSSASAAGAAHILSRIKRAAEDRGPRRIAGRTYISVRQRHGQAQPPCHNPGTKPGRPPTWGTL